MRTTARRDALARHHRVSRERPLAGLAAVRSLVLGAAVFTLATITGVLLSGAALVEPDAGARTEPVSSVSSSDTRTGVGVVDPRDPLFAHSMVYAGAGALAISITGMVMVARRRRHW